MQERTKIHYTRRALLFSLFLSGLLGLLSLSHWQWSRSHEKAALQQNTASPGNVLQGWGELNAAERFRKIRLTGAYLGRDWLLDNQIHQGQFGYEVFTPLCKDQSCVLVGRGWIAGQIQRDQLPVVPTLTESVVTVTAQRDHWPETVLVDTNEVSDQWPRRFQAWLAEDFIAEEPRLRTDLLLRLEADEPGALTLRWTPVVMGPEKHLGYAFQWFAMAVAWLVLWVWVWRRGAVEVRTQAQAQTTQQEKKQQESHS